MSEKKPKKSNKERILYLYRFLAENTDSSRSMSTGEIIDEMTKAGYRVTRNTLKDDIDSLNAFGFDVVVNREFSNQIFVGSRTFELTEARLLVEAVASSRFISPAKSDQLIRKLKRAVGPNERKKLTPHIMTKRHIKSDNKEIYYNVDEILDAYEEEKKVRFRYFDYSPEKKKVYRNAGKFYSVSPYFMIWSEDYYYMVGFSDDDGEIRTYRIDRMNKTQKSEEDAVPRPEGFDDTDYCRKVFDMYEGTEQEVVLECRNRVMKNIIDRFGVDVETWIVSDEKFRARATVSASRTFYAWVFGFLGDIQIVEPQEMKDEFLEICKGFLEGQK